MRKRKRWIFLAIIVALVIFVIIKLRSEPHIVAGSYLVVDISGNYAEAPPASGNPSRRL